MPPILSHPSWKVQNWITIYANVNPFSTQRHVHGSIHIPCECWVYYAISAVFQLNKCCSIQEDVYTINNRNFSGLSDKAWKHPQNVLTGV